MINFDQLLNTFDLFCQRGTNYSNVQQRQIDLALCFILKSQQHNLNDSCLDCDTFEQFRDQFTKLYMTDSCDVDSAIWLLLGCSPTFERCYNDNMFEAP